MIRDIGGVSTPPIRGGSFNSPQYTGEPWGEPLEGFLPPKLPVRAGEGALQGTVGHRLRGDTVKKPRVDSIYQAQGLKKNYQAQIIGTELVGSLPLLCWENLN